MAKRKKSGGKKRTITPEHLAKMQAGKAAAAKKRERTAKFDNLDERLGLTKKKD